MNCHPEARRSELANTYVIPSEAGFIKRNAQAERGISHSSKQPAREIPRPAGEGAVLRNDLARESPIEALLIRAGWRKLNSSCKIKVSRNNPNII
jgi:hypothetical protein